MPFVPPPDYTEFAKLKRDKTFIESVRRAIEIKRKMAEMEEELKELNDDIIEPTLKHAGVRDNTTITFEKVPIAVRDVSSGFRLDESKLVMKGVSKKVIEACKVENKRRRYVEYGLKPRGGKKKPESGRTSVSDTD